MQDTLSSSSTGYTVQQDKDLALIQGQDARGDLAVRVGQLVKCKLQAVCVAVVRNL